MSSLVGEETALPALSVAEIAYVLSQRLTLSLTRMLVRNETSPALLQLDTDACLHLNRVYAQDDQSEFLFFMHELASALHEWRMHSLFPFDVRASMRVAACAATAGMTTWDVHIGVASSVLPRCTMTREAILAACTAGLHTPFCISRVILDTSGMDYAVDMRVVLDLHQLLVPLMVHWLLQNHVCDARPLMLSMYVPSPVPGAETLLMRLYIHQRAAAETRLKRRKLTASGFTDNIYIAVTSCAALEVALRQRLHRPSSLHTA